MQVFYDIALGLFLQSPGANNEITQLTAKRASNNPISLQFLNNGTPTNLPTGTQFIFGAKQSNGNNGGFYDDAYAVYVDNTGWTGPDENGFYNCQPGYNTTKLNSLFGYTYPNMDTLPHPDSVTLDGEISWLKPGDTLWSKTPYWQLLCYNDVSKGIEGVPTSGGPVYPSPSAIELIANKGAANGYCPLGSDSRVPVMYLPIATGTSAGIVQVGSGLSITSGVLSAAGGGGSGPLPQARVAYVDASGNDGTGVVGTSTVAAKPFLTAQAAYDALVTAGGGLLKMGIGTGWTITLTADWDSGISVSGSGALNCQLSIVGNGADDPTTPTSGYNVDLVSDSTVSISVLTNGGNATSNVDNSNGGNGGNVTLKNAWLGYTSANGGSGNGSSVDGNGGNGGDILLSNCITDPEGGTSISSIGGGDGGLGTFGNSGNGGNLMLIDCNLPLSGIYTTCGAVGNVGVSGTINLIRCTLHNGNIGVSNTALSGGTVNADNSDIGTVQGADTTAVLNTNNCVYAAIYFLTHATNNSTYMQTTP